MYSWLWLLPWRIRARESSNTKYCIWSNGKWAGPRVQADEVGRDITGILGFGRQYEDNIWLISISLCKQEAGEDDF